MKIKIATRKSQLAQIQAEIVGKMLKEKLHMDYEKVLITTEGDRVLDVTVDKIGGKGLFVKDIETALLEGRAHMAVHSMKDVPHEMPEGFEIIAIPEREDARDVLVSAGGLKLRELPHGARIGSSSIRRAKQILLKRPDIEVVLVRGNVDTRIRKMEQKKLDGLVLAAAGLKRLKLENLITEYFDPQDFVPAVGQGALGIEILATSPYREYFRQLDSHDVRKCVEAERSFMRKLNGDCHKAVGAYAYIKGDRMYMTGLFEINGRLIKKDIEGNKEDYPELGRMLAEAILEENKGSIKRKQH